MDGLYGGLGDDGQATNTASTASGTTPAVPTTMSFMPATLRRKPKAPSSAERKGIKRRRSGSSDGMGTTSSGVAPDGSLAAAVAAARAAAAAASLTSAPSSAPAAARPSPAAPTPLQSLALPPSIPGEYDPFRPNLFELVVAAEAAESQRAARNTQQGRAGPSTALPTAPLPGAGRGRGRVLPAWAAGPSIAPATAPAPAHTPGGLSVAAKLMAQMGYKAGGGLGKREHGITSALEHVKTGTHTGTIVAPEGHGAAAAASLAPGAVLPGATRVLLVLGTAQPNAVPANHKAAVTAAATPHGAVVNVVVLQLSHEQRKEFGTGPQDSVRVFVEFHSSTAASAAAAAWSASPPWGPATHVSFFAEGLYETMQLLPQLK